VSLDKLGKDVCKLDFIVERGNGPAILGRVQIWEKDGEGMDIIVVNARDVRIRNDNEGEVAKSLDAVGEADGEERERKVGRREEGVGCERRTAVSAG
jgi:hypothetical protein